MTDVSTSLIQAAYIVAALLFIMSLAGLSKHETARDGNVLGMVGMGIALVATLWLSLRDAPWSALSSLIAVAMVIGAAIGIWRARTRRDDRHARADRDAPLVRRRGGGARRLNTFVATSGGVGGVGRTSSRSSSASSSEP